jgi:hypothetical protein
MANTFVYNGKIYTTTGDWMPSGSGGAFSNITDRINKGYLKNGLASGTIAQYNPAAQPAQQPVQAPQPTFAPDFQGQLNTLTNQASNALNGGLLGYTPSVMTSGGSNPQAFTAPTGNLNSGLWRTIGLLGGMTNGK